jgi:hypothetical protein
LERITGRYGGTTLMSFASGLKIASGKKFLLMGARKTSTVEGIRVDRRWRASMPHRRFNSIRQTAAQRRLVS